MIFLEDVRLKSLSLHAKYFYCENVRLEMSLRGKSFEIMIHKWGLSYIQITHRTCKFQFMIYNWLDSNQTLDQIEPLFGLDKNQILSRFWQSWLIVNFDLGFNLILSWTKQGLKLKWGMKIFIPVLNLWMIF